MPSSYITTRKTTLNWIALFRLAHGRGPTRAEFEAESFEDKEDERMKKAEAQIRKLLEASDD